MRFLIFPMVLFSAVTASAAPMVRVTAVKDSQTVIVDDHGVAAELRLAGIVIPPAEEALATAYLRETLVSRWVLLETGPRGAYLYRSPDALYINGELARRAYAQPHTAMIYLGEAMPGPQRTSKATPNPSAPRVVAPGAPQRVRHAPRSTSRVPKM